MSLQFLACIALVISLALGGGQSTIFDFSLASSPGRPGVSGPGPLSVSSARRLLRPMPVSLSLSSTAQTPTNVPQLERGKAIERELAGGETHSYQVTLASGQYLHLVVDQRGIDVVVTLFGPDGTKLVEMDSPNGTQGPEPVSLIAETSGDYRLEVRSLEKEAAPGRYEVKIGELRAAISQDRNRIAAERVYAEGTQLLEQGTAKSLPRAIEKFEEALLLWRAVGARDRESDTLKDIGYIYSLLSENRKALKYYDQALQLKRILGDGPGEAGMLHNIASVYNVLGKNEQALEYFGQALRLRQTLKDDRGVANTLNSIGSVYLSRSDPRRALDYFDQALPLRRAVKDHRGEAITLNNIGMTYAELGELQEALKYYNQSLPLSRSVENHRAAALTLNNIGIIYAELGEHQKALEYYDQVLPIHRAVENRLGEGQTLNNIGTTYAELGESERALEYYNQALTLWRAIEYLEGEAATLSNIGLVYDSLNNKRNALKYYMQTLLISRKVGNRVREAIALSNIGGIYGDWGQHQKALKYSGQALSLFQAAGERQKEALALNNVGVDYYWLGKLRKALDYYQRALLLHQAVGNRSGEALTLYNMARAERDRGNLTEARSRVEATLSIVEFLRTKVVAQELRASYLASKQNYYEFYVDLLMHLHRLHPSGEYGVAALQASERARARSLLELLTEARADIRQGVEPAPLERERSLQQLLNAKAERLTRLLSSERTEEQEATARKEVETLLTEFQEVQAQIRVRSPRYAALTQPQPLDLKEIQQQVLDENTLLLEYALGKERSFLWAVTPTSITSHELPKRAEVESAARRVHDVLVKRASTFYPDALARLSQMLLGPVTNQLGTKRLLIVPDGALQYVPFAALPVPDLRPQTSNQGQGTKDKGQSAIDRRS